MTRRASLIGLALLMSPSLGLASTVTAGPMVGATDHDSAWIWARADGPGRLTVSYRAAGDDAWLRSEPAHCDPEADFVAKVEVSGLAPSTAYDYALQLDGQPVAGGPWRFRTLSVAGAGKLRLAFGSCVHRRRFPQQPIFNAIRAAQPDVFVFMGDSVYYTRENSSRPETMWSAQRAQRETPELQALLARVPTLAQWDDHDYGPNNGDGTYEHKVYARRVFQSYWANGSWGEEGQGIYSRHSLGPVDLFLLDTRYFRDPNRRRADDPQKTILGSRQREWLLDELAASQAPVKLVATAMQFLADYHPLESWQMAQSERATILSELRRREIQGVVFLSGDRHMAEALRLKDGGPGYDLWELTSSPLANRVTSFLPETELRVFSEGRAHNFGWVEVDTARDAVVLELRDESGVSLWSVQLDLKLARKTPKRYF